MNGVAIAPLTSSASRVGRRRGSLVIVRTNRRRAMSASLCTNIRGASEMRRNQGQGDLITHTVSYFMSPPRIPMVIRFRAITAREEHCRRRSQELLAIPNERKKLTSSRSSHESIHRAKREGYRPAIS